MSRERPVMIICRNLADVVARNDWTEGGGNFLGRECHCCGKALVLSAQGQSQEVAAKARGARVETLCHLCGAMIAVIMDQEGDDVEVQINPAAKRNLKRSPYARPTLDFWKRFTGGK